MGSFRVRYLTGSRLLAEALGRRMAVEPDLDLVDGPEADVVLIDVADPADAVAAVDASPAAARVVVLSVDDALGGALDAARAGAAAWLDRRCSADDLLRVLRGVVMGGAFFPREVHGELLASLRADAIAGRSGCPLARLTEREREVLDALGEGRANRSIGEHLGLSYNTVRTHINEIFRKLGVHTRVDAVRALRDAR